MAGIRKGQSSNVRETLVGRLAGLYAMEYMLNWVRTRQASTKEKLRPFPTRSNGNTELRATNIGPPKYAATAAGWIPHGLLPPSLSPVLWLQRSDYL